MLLFFCGELVLPTSYPRTTSNRSCLALSFAFRFSFLFFLPHTVLQLLTHSLSLFLPLTWHHHCTSHTVTPLFLVKLPICTLHPI